MCVYVGVQARIEGGEQVWEQNTHGAVAIVASTTRSASIFVWAVSKRLTCCI